jgi:hypothetical protein
LSAALAAATAATTCLLTTLLASALATGLFAASFILVPLISLRHFFPLLDMSSAQPTSVWKKLLF